MNVRRVVVIGGGGLGREVVSLVRESPGFEVIGVVDDTEIEPAALRRMGVPYLGEVASLESLDPDCAFVVGVGSPTARRALAMQALGVGLEPVTIVHPAASVGPTVSLGRGSVVMAGAVLTAHVDVGDWAVINASVVISHDTRVGVAVTINPGAVIADGVVVGDETFVGAATFLSRGTRVTAGSVVPPGERVLSNVT